MNMTGEAQIGAPRERVYEALNDPEILKRSIPGCEEIEKLSDTELSAKVVAKVGPVKAKFTGQVTLSDLNPPESYTISGEGKGGAAGFAKGSAKVNLEPDGSRYGHALRGERASRRQVGTGGQPLDRWHRQETGRRVLHELRRDRRRRGWRRGPGARPSPLAWPRHRKPVAEEQPSKERPVQVAHLGRHRRRHRDRCRLDGPKLAGFRVDILDPTG